MAPQIQRARAALRAIHRMDALMRATHEAQQADIEAGQRSDDAMQAAEDNLRQPLLEAGPTPQEAVAADVRTSRTNSKKRDSAVYRRHDNAACIVMPLAAYLSMPIHCCMFEPPQVWLAHLGEHLAPSTASGELWKTSRLHSST